MDAPPKRSLMDKWKEHYNTKDQAFKISPERASTAGVIFFWTFTLSLFYSALWIHIPYMAKYEVNKRYWMTVVSWFITAQVIVNWFLVASKKTNQVNDKTVPQNNGQRLVTSLPEGWKACPTCQLDTPPRSFHCKMCNMCVLKRDHHCFFTGSCVGFFNQRRFIVFSFYVMVGNLFCLWMVFSYLSDPLPLFSRHAATYILPVTFYKFFTGSLSIVHLFLFIQMYAGFVTLLGGSWFFFWEMLVTYRGQTSYEAMKNIHRYRGSASVHFRSVFGMLWPLNFIMPLPTAQLGDGVDWTLSIGAKAN